VAEKPSSRGAVDELDDELDGGEEGERRRFDWEESLRVWETAVEFHRSNALEKLLELLKFPGGWLNNCVDPQDEDELLHVNAVRRIVLKKVGRRDIFDSRIRHTY
jgi:hypothetical protein